jgi:signal peptidase I
MTIKGFFQRRRATKKGKNWLHHAELCRKTYEDVADPSLIEQLKAAEVSLRRAMQTGNATRITADCDKVGRTVDLIVPSTPFPALKENLEVIVVAVAVAMAFRCYVLQPFKIPTGSMQPSLYGIYYTPQSEHTFLDRIPFNIVRCALFGTWYTEFKAETAGRVFGPRGEQGGMQFYDIGGLAHAIPRDLILLVRPGDEVVTGQVLARGNRVLGDHLFVNRVKWNFLPPKRGEVIVFRTDGIPALNDKKTHYIKRLCGLPGEQISIHPPVLMVDGHPATERGMLEAIQRQVPGYEGYQLARGMGAEYLASTNDIVKLAARQYLGFGDNTLNSYDSRYWGPVPESSLVGPAWFVYWPLSSRWGFVK